MDLGKGLGQLTYSTLVHPGDTWDEMWNSLTTFVPKLKHASLGKNFGISAVIQFVRTDADRESAKRVELKDFLDRNDMYLYTVNAFPYGPFKEHRSRNRSMSRTGGLKSERSTP
jgi:hypothetical protein